MKATICKSCATHGKNFLYCIQSGHSQHCRHCQRSGHTANKCKATHQAQGGFLPDYSDEDSEARKDTDSVFIGSEGFIENIEDPTPILLPVTPPRIETCTVCEAQCNESDYYIDRCGSCSRALDELNKANEENTKVYKASNKKTMGQYMSKIHKAKAVQREKKRQASFL